MARWRFECPADDCDITRRMIEEIRQYGADFRFMPDAAYDIPDCLSYLLPKESRFVEVDEYGVTWEIPDDWWPPKWWPSSILERMV